MTVRIVSQNSPRLPDRMRAEIRLRHYSLRTEQSYVDWAKRYILFHGKKYPQKLGAEAVRDLLSHLASERKVSASTQNQAKSALLFLYREVLKIELPWLSEVVAAKATRRLPVVLTPTEARRLLTATSGTMGLMVALLHGTGMRPLEGLRLRVKDVEFERREIIVREAKGHKDRVTVLPENLILRATRARIRENRVFPFPHRPWTAPPSPAACAPSSHPRPS